MTMMMTKRSVEIVKERGGEEAMDNHNWSRRGAEAMTAAISRGNRIGGVEIETGRGILTGTRKIRIEGERRIESQARPKAWTGENTSRRCCDSWCLQ